MEVRARGVPRRRPNLIGFPGLTMSVEFTVYMPRAQMPTPSDWAEAIADAGFPAELDAAFDVEEFSGFLPCRYAGAEAGFEYSSGPIEFVDELELPSEFDFSVTFATHSSLRELASSVVSAAVLCSVSGGVLVDPQGAMAVAADGVIAWARDQLGEIDV